MDTHNRRDINLAWIIRCWKNFEQKNLWSRIHISHGLPATNKVIGEINERCAHRKRQYG